MMPVGIGFGRLADNIKTLDLFCRKFPLHRTEVLAELFFRAGSDDEAAYRRALQQPVQSYLSHGLSSFHRQFV